jgi:hypothetical protein
MLFNQLRTIVGAPTFWSAGQEEAHARMPVPPEAGEERPAFELSTFNFVRSVPFFRILLHLKLIADN